MLPQMPRSHSFLWLSNIPLCVCVCVCVCVYSTSSLSIHILMDILCFHILSIVNNAAINIGVHISFQISVFIFLGQIPCSEITGSYGISIFCFFEELQTILFSIVAAPVCIPTNSAQEFPFGDTWVTQLVEHLPLGHGPRVLGLSPASGARLSKEPALSPC